MFSLKTDQSLHKHTVLLVDDIISSGSSLRESAKLLKSAGAEKIIGIVLATNLFDVPKQK